MSRLFPVQARSTYKRDAAVIPEAVYMAAYEVYAHVWAPQAAMIDYEKGCRGGFSSGEIVAFLYARTFPRAEWRTRVDEALKGATL
jgi:hypothetical protein